ncbi:hypothetical protein PCE1_003331 [Barthelona sp. PCE]
MRSICAWALWNIRLITVLTKKHVMSFKRGEHMPVRPNAAACTDLADKIIAVSQGSSFFQSERQPTGFFTNKLRWMGCYSFGRKPLMLIQSEDRIVVL